VKPVHCKSCRKLLGKYHVLVGEIQCPRCNYRTEYRVLTERFIRAVQDGDNLALSGEVGILLDHVAEPIAQA